MDNSRINTIIFDFGIVLFNVCPQKTDQEITSLCGDKAASFFSLKKQHSLCDQFEMGLIDSETFAEGIGRLVGIKELDVKKIIDAWSAMIIEMPLYKYNLLNSLRKDYRLIALSNTNIAHYHAINYKLAEQYALSSMKDLFDETYLSFEVGLRKPDPNLFRHVIQTSNLNPNHCLFIDDLEENLKTAKSLGINTALYQMGDNLEQFIQKEMHGCKKLVS